MKEKTTNPQITEFAIWMTENTTLQKSSIYKYSHAVATISKEMQELGVINGDLLTFENLILDKTISIILNKQEFFVKNKRGNNMYSKPILEFN